jgi:hypothetical protein
MTTPHRRRLVAFAAGCLLALAYHAAAKAPKARAPFPIDAGIWLSSSSGAMALWNSMRSVGISSESAINEVCLDSPACSQVARKQPDGGWRLEVRFLPDDDLMPKPGEPPFGKDVAP